MYRLMLYFLICLVLLATVFSAAGLLAYKPLAILASAAWLSLACYAINQVIARLVRARTNVESQFITALILALIAGPGPFPANLGLLTLLAFLAMGSKYLLAYRRRHAFNPAAFAVAAAALLLREGASWWVSSRLLLPFVLVGGLLVARKTRRFHLVVSFLVTYLVLLVIVYPLRGIPVSFLPNLLREVTLSSPLFFFTFVMLVEPISGPQSRRARIVYGAGVACVWMLYGQLLPSFPYNLETALLTGNAVVFLTRRQPRLTMALVREDRLGSDIHGFWFEPAPAPRFQPGQYLEWTLPHRRVDSGGVRRYFTIASSPTESRILLATRISEQQSSFKRALLALQPGEQVTATNLEGEFVLPRDTGRPLAFIAGGIGITPFRSMVKYLLDKRLSRDITLFYSARGVDDLAFRDLFDEAGREFGLKSVYTLTRGPAPAGWPGRTGAITPAMIREEMPDYLERLFYVSGSEPMVMAFGKLLAGMGVKRANVKRDYFPGYGGT